MRHFPAHISLTYGEIGDAHLVPRFDSHRLPDTAGHKTRPPVPPVFICGLAQISFSLGLGLWLPGIRGGCLSSGFQWRRKHDVQRIFSCVQMSLGRHSPYSKAVAGHEHLHAVHGNFGCSVEAVKNKIDMGAGKQGRRNLKAQPILPVFLFDPLQFGLVVAIERVGNLLVGEQIQVNVAGDSGRKPTALARLRVNCNLPELPAVIERDHRILRWFQLRLRHFVPHVNSQCQYCAAYHSTTGNSGLHSTSSRPSAKPIERPGKATDEIVH